MHCILTNHNLDGYTRGSDCSLTKKDNYLAIGLHFIVDLKHNNFGISLTASFTIFQIDIYVWLQESRRHKKPETRAKRNKILLLPCSALSRNGRKNFIY